LTSEGPTGFSRNPGDLTHSQIANTSACWNWKKALSMAISDWQMNRFERILFRIALVLGILLISIRLGAVLVVWYLHHPH